MALTEKEREELTRLKKELIEIQDGPIRESPTDISQEDLTKEVLTLEPKVEFVDEPGVLERFAGGARAGFRREEVGGTIAERLGGFAGRFGPPIAGSLALGAATGGTALVPLAGAAALGAAGGEAFGQLGARAAGGQPPETPLEAAKEIATTGLEGAASELGLGLGIKAIKKTLPIVSQALLKTPFESIKRAIKRPELVPLGGNSARAEVEKQGIGLLRSLQETIEQARRGAGQKVDNALARFQRRVRGERIIDLSTMADEAEELFRQSSLSEPSVAQLTTSSEINKITKLIETIRKNPKIDPRGAINLRRQLDDLVSFKRGGVKAISSDLGERTIKNMGSNLRKAIGDSAERVGFDDLAEANFNFSKIANTFDEVGQEIGTKDLSQRSLLGRLNRLTSSFNRGGLSREILENLASQIPGGFKTTNKLLDSLAARAFTELPVGTPSGMVKDLIRILASPTNIGRGIRAGSEISPIVRGTTRAAAIGAIPRQ